MYIIIPMAGLGTRFQKVSDQNPNYKKPKPLISVRNYPMVRWATRSLPFVNHPGQGSSSNIKVEPNHLIFIILKEHDREYDLERELRAIYSDDITVIKLDNVTRGAAETAYHAKKLVDPNEDIIVSDSDHFFDGKGLEQAILARTRDTMGIIPVFTPPNDGIPRWSYSLITSHGNFIEQVGEKDVELMRKGALANIGAYYFSKAGMFFSEIEEVIAKNEMTGDEGKKEFYIAPLYQRLIAKGFKIQAVTIPEVWGLGTPTDLEYFLANCSRVHP